MKRTTRGDCDNTDLSRAWALLGVRANPRTEDVRAAFCARAVTTHPDRCSDPGAKERFQSLHAAYEIALERSRQAEAASGGGGGGRGAGRGAAEYDWRAEAARVRATYGAMLERLDALNARRRAARRTFAPAAAALSTACPAAHPYATAHIARPTAGGARRGKSTGLASAAAEKAAKKAENAAKSRRVAIEERRRLRVSAQALQALTRAAAAESARRQSVAAQEQWEWRRIAMELVEGRIRHTVQELEEVSWKVLNSQLNVDAEEDSDEKPRVSQNHTKNGRLGGM